MRLLLTACCVAVLVAMVPTSGWSFFCIPGMQPVMYLKCLQSSCTKCGCPAPISGGCPVVDDELRQIQKEKTEINRNWASLQEMATNQVTVAALQLGQPSAVLPAMSNGLMDESQLRLEEFDFAEYNCMPKHEDLLANGLVTCPEGEGETLCRLRTLQKAMEYVSPQSRATTPTERAATYNNQQACYDEHGVRARVLGEIGIRLLQAYRYRIYEYLELVESVSVLPCHDPLLEDKSITQYKEDFAETGVLNEVPACLRQEMNILSMIQRDVSVLQQHLQQFTSVQQAGRMWASMRGNSNPFTPE